MPALISWSPSSGNRAERESHVARTRLAALWTTDHHPAAHAELSARTRPWRAERSRQSGDSRSKRHALRYSLDGRAAGDPAPTFAPVLLGSASQLEADELAPD